MWLLIISLGVYLYIHTCVTHIIIKRCVDEVAAAARLVPGLRVSTVLVFGHGVRVGAQVAGFQRRLRLQAGVIAGLDLWNAPEDMVQAQAVADFVDHGVSVAERAVKRRVQHYASWRMGTSTQWGSWN